MLVVVENEKDKMRKGCCRAFAAAAVMAALDKR